MTQERQVRVDDRAKIIKALAHPTRLFLVEELARKENCVWNLTEMVGADISTISKHLAILKKAGILEDEKRGLQVCYRLRMSCVRDFLGCVNKMAVKHKRRKD